MHRKNPMLPIVLGLIFLGLGLTGQASATQPASEQLPAPQAVPAAAKTVLVPLGTTKVLQLDSKKDIKSNSSSVEGVVRVSATPDNIKAVLVTGQQVGRTRITITAMDDTKQDFDVSVEIDVESIRNLLLRVAPTANLSVSAVGGPGASGGPSGIVIEGNAGPAENVNLIMRTAESIVGAGKVINGMRTDGVMQVQLDVVIALVSRTEARRMAFDFWSSGQHHDFSSQSGGGIQMPTTISSQAGVLQFTNMLGNQNGVPPNFYTGLYSSNQFLFAFMQILRNESIAKLLAEPRLVTLSGRAATFLSGGEQAVPAPGGLGAVSVNFQPFGTKLTFLPFVLNNGKIYIEVEPEVSTLSIANGTSIAGTVVPGRVVQRVHTSIEMEPGQTFVIGGMIQHDVNGATTKVPVLGDLPFIGAAFSSKFYTEDETEMLVMVTPHLVDPMSCNQVPKVLPGQETRSPDDFELFLEGILEAPRGQRDVNVHGRYVPAYKHSPSAATMPCGGDGGSGACGHGSVSSGLADAPAIGYPKVSSAGDRVPDKAAGKIDPSAELLPPLDVPSEGSEVKPAEGQPLK